MRKRQEAPGELELVRAFVNTLDVLPGAEELAQPADLRRWLSEHRLASPGLHVSAADLRRALQFREALRAVLTSHTEGTPVPPEACRSLDEVARRARLSLSFEEQDGAALEPEAGGVDGALGRLATIIHSAIGQGTWARLKACRDHSCEWAFYDHTKNRSGTWCTMQVCGNRAKARAYRDRRGGSRSRQDAGTGQT
jgi:predicted RNA-binding Zn ribbon-like protein